MTDADASRDMPRAAHAVADARPLRLMAAFAVLLVIGAALGLWARFGEGVYGQMLLNAVIACF